MLARQRFASVPQGTKGAALYRACESCAVGRPDTFRMRMHPIINTHTHSFTHNEKASSLFTLQTNIVQFCTSAYKCCRSSAVANRGFILGSLNSGCHGIPKSFSELLPLHPTTKGRGFETHALNHHHSSMASQPIMRSIHFGGLCAHQIHDILLHPKIIERTAPCLVITRQAKMPHT